MRYSLIMDGGSGIRLYPMSTADRIIHQIQADLYELEQLFKKFNKA